MTTDLISVEAAKALREAADVLRHDAALIRRQFQTGFDAADPLPAVEERRTLASTLDMIAATPPSQRAATAARTVSPSDLDLLRRTAAGIDSPSTSTDRQDSEIREKYSRVLHEVHEILKMHSGVRDSARPGA